MINDHPGIFHVQDFHDGLVPVNENKNSAVLYILLHMVGYYAAQGVKTFAHVDRERVQIIIERTVKVEHG